MTTIPEAHHPVFEKCEVDEPGMRFPKGTFVSGFHCTIHLSERRTGAVPVKRPDQREWMGAAACFRCMTKGWVR